MDIELLRVRAGIVLEDSFEAGSKWEVGDANLAEFARLVAEAEREECAKVAENYDYNNRHDIDPPRTMARYIAAAIRARSSN